MSRSRRADYGIDAPGALRGLGLVAGAAVILAFLGLALDNAWLWWTGVGSFAYFGILTGLHLWYSKVGKLRERPRLLDRAGLEGDERVLDVGCGRGLLLIEAARRLTRGTAVGVDIWSGVDQSRNVPGAPFENARVEDVEDRVEVCTGDARALPFRYAEFHVVVSQFALHNIRSVEGRQRAVREVARVLRPGGRLVVLDLARTNEYVAELRLLGWSDLARLPRTWRVFPPARYVVGTKPSR
jgi:SAM-dependent methyltransferase